MDKASEFIRRAKSAGINPRVIFDVGAFNGDESVELAEAFPDAKVYAFECVPENIMLCAQTVQHHPNIFLVPAALTAKSGRRQFHKSTSHNPECGSLLAPNGKYFEPMPTKPIEVQCYAAADFIKAEGIPAPDLIWMDVQGAELDVLRGLGGYIESLQLFCAEVTYRAYYNGQMLVADFDKAVSELGFAKRHEEVGIADWFGNAIYQRRKPQEARKQPVATVVYIHMPSDPLHLRYATRFVDTMLRFPGGVPHKTLVVCNGAPPNDYTRLLFQDIPHCWYMSHDDSGWDIGGFMAACRNLPMNEMTVFCGGSTYFRRAGWLRRMREAWLKYGPGFYGVTANYEISPHLNTTSFWCQPKLMLSYRDRVVTRAERYAFEHGPSAMWKRATALGLPVKLITWDGDYDWPDWRKVVNGLRNGDQSNCLAYWHHHDNYAKETPAQKRITEKRTNTIVDPQFLRFMAGRGHGIFGQPKPQRHP